ncbi:hypothetical protein ACVRXQ_06970 [Streptococcus panodentis]|uniref:Uncharacterized protein n=1 Tax=Streptococcus panodentis TaxID=1581472 RepID=A0ABS5AUC6_9STRE|nr:MULTISPECIES: hypothetical protein [Streptococcus]KXT82698.1 hypothetical protein STRDD11_01771 [Streptococcus sp. DD11]MBP2620177.1 hypothetical protein [Streptococcus panodentis]
MFITQSAIPPVKEYFSSSKTADLTEIKKTIERQIITNILAPILLSQKSDLQSQYDTLFTDIAKTIEESVQTAADQLDSSIKGQFSKKVVAALKENSQKYEAI